MKKYDETEINKFMKLVDLDKIDFRAINSNLSNKEKIRSYWITRRDISKIIEESSKRNCYLSPNLKINGIKSENVKKLRFVSMDWDAGKDHKNTPATDKEINEVRDKVMNFADILGKDTGCRPTIIFTGNGFLVLIRIPDFEIYEDNRKEIEQKIGCFLDYVGKDYNTVIDKTQDLARIVRIPGTINLKGGRMARIVEINNEKNRIFLKKILSINLNKRKVKSSKPESIFFKEIMKDPKLWNLYNAEQKAMKKFKSRSEAEQSLVNMLVSREFDKEQIFEIMALCKIGKWQEANLSYRNLTYEKALKIVDIPNQNWESGKPISTNPDDIQVWNYRDIENIKIPKNNYIVKDFIDKGTINVFVGESNLFKTWISFILAICVASGKKFLNYFKVSRLNVLILDLENNLAVIKKRFPMIRKGLKIRKKDFPLGYITPDSQGKLDNKDYLKKIIKYIKKNGTSLLIIDTMKRAGDYKENNADEVSDFYTKSLKPIIQKTGCSLLLLHHASKKGKEYRGSSDIKGMVDNMFTLNKNKWGDIILEFDKVRNDKTPSSFKLQLDFDPDSVFGTAIPMHPSENAKPKLIVDKLSDEIMKICPKSFSKKKCMEILKKNHINFSETGLKNSISRLKELNKLSNPSRGHYMKI